MYRFFLVACVLSYGISSSILLPRVISRTSSIHGLPLSQAQVIYIKMPPKSYNIKCSEEGTCRYKSVLHPEPQRDLAQMFSIPKNEEEVRRGGKDGRRFSFGEDSLLQWRRKKKEKYKIEKYKKKNREFKKYWNKKNTKANIINNIKIGGLPRKKDSKLNIHERTMNTEEEILRPNINFISNARPSILKWREWEVKRTPIVKSKAAYDVRSISSSSSRKRYRSEEGPFPLGRSRNFLGQQSSPSSSPIIRLSSFRLTGLPNSITTFTQPIKQRRLYTEQEGLEDNKV